MQFIVIARDGTDADALNRRLAAREAHMAHLTQAAQTGEQLIAAAMVNDKDQMCGSVLIVDFENREALDNWLKTEAYVTGNVWQDIEVIPCKLPPPFQHLISKKP